MRRLRDLKSFLQAFISNNIKKQGQKYCCLLDSQIFANYKSALTHLRSFHKHDFEQLLRVLLNGSQLFSSFKFFIFPIFCAARGTPRPPSLIIAHILHTKRDWIASLSLIRPGERNLFSGGCNFSSFFSHFLLSQQRANSAGKLIFFFFFCSFLFSHFVPWVLDFCQFIAICVIFAGNGWLYWNMDENRQ